MHIYVKEKGKLNIPTLNNLRENEWNKKYFSPMLIIVFLWHFVRIY